MKALITLPFDTAICRVFQSAIWGCTLLLVASLEPQFPAKPISRTCLGRPRQRHSLVEIVGDAKGAVLAFGSLGISVVQRTLVSVALTARANARRTLLSVKTTSAPK
jgi:hypothetical protein